MCLRQAVAHKPEDVFNAVERVHARAIYSALALIAGYGMVGFRDPNAIRPLIVGYRENADGPDYIMASESVVLDVLGYKEMAYVHKARRGFLY